MTRMLVERERAIAVDRDALRRRSVEGDDAPMPLMAALLEIAATALSFATPGHRAGRSCTTLPKC